MVVTSGRTAYLAGELEAIRAKIEKLTTARDSIQTAKTKIKSNMEGIYDLHVKGQKYELMKDEETDTIDNFSKRLKKVKQSVLDDIDANLKTLGKMEEDTRQLYRASVAADIEASKSEDISAY